MYLFVVIDWYSRYVVDFELSNTIDKSLVMNCMERAPSRKQPEIINSDQGGYFTNPDYQRLLLGHGVKISMVGNSKRAARGSAALYRRIQCLLATLVY